MTYHMLTDEEVDRLEKSERLDSTIRGLILRLRHEQKVAHQFLSELDEIREILSLDVNERDDTNIETTEIAQRRMDDLLAFIEM